MDDRRYDYGLLENYKELSVGIIEFALDDYVTTIKSLNRMYAKLDKSLADDFKAKYHHERVGDIIHDIYKKIFNLHEIEAFIKGEWVKKLSTLDSEYLFQKTQEKLIRKGYKVKLMGLTVQTDDKGAMVFATEKEGANGTFTMYSIGISSKNNNGEWVKGYISCRFKKGVTVTNKSKIKINNAFFTVTKSGDKTYTSLMITEFSVLESGEGGTPANANSVDEFIKIPEGAEDELPF